VLDVSDVSDVSDVFDMGLLSWLSWSPRDEDLLQETRTRRGREGNAGPSSRSRAVKKRGPPEGGADAGGSKSVRNGGRGARGGPGRAAVKGSVQKASVSKKKTKAPAVDSKKKKKEKKEKEKEEKKKKEKEKKTPAKASKERVSSSEEHSGTDDDVEGAPSASDSELSLETPRGNGSKLARTEREKRHGEKETLKKATPKLAPKSTPTAPYTMPSHFTKSLWKVRPLQVDEKLRVFIEGRDDGIQRYDGGDFQQWLEDCKAGRGDPLEAGAYPLVVQDSDLRQVLEIKYPSERALGTLEDEYGRGRYGGQMGEKAESASQRNSKTPTSRASASTQQTNRITIPHWKKLPGSEWPDTILQHSLTMPLLVRTVDGGAELVQRNAPRPADESSHERAYMRYMMPTPDDWDQAIEYDLDEDDEKWLEAYNRRTKNSANSTLKEEWLEHLIDRMEKEYTSELQKHPEKWTCKKDGQEGEEGEGGSQGPLAYMKGQLPPPLILPSISEMFPLSVCLKVFGLGGGAGHATSSASSASSASAKKHQSPDGTQVIDEKIIKDVYNYWKKKHQKSGLPLIQRLWYEPPWHRKASEEDMDGGDDDTTVFSGFDLHPSLARIRKRKMNHDEVQLRFDCLRRDFEQVRTIADLIRRREKLKLQETSILKQEWASRMRDVRRAAKAAVAAGQPGSLTYSRPPKLASLVESKRSAVASREHRQDVMAEQEQKLAIERTLTEDRAARLAARRDVRAEALRIRRERIAIKKSSSKTKPKKPKSRKPSGKKTTPKKTGGRQPRSSTGQFQSFRK
jgi:hypothetical protein